MRMATKRLTELVPAPYNPRTISDDALAGLRESIRRFGVVEPIIWNERTGHVVGGHQRLKVLAADQVEETEVVVVSLDPAEEKALNVALNSPAISGEFTPDLISVIEDVELSFPDLADDLLLGDLLEDIAPPTEAEEWDLSLVHDEFVVTIRGILPLQAEVRKRLEGLDGVTSIEASSVLDP